MRQRYRRVCVCCVVLAGTACVHAQVSIAAALAAQRHTASHDSKASTSPPTTLEAALQEVFQDADIVFAGEVTAITREAAAIAVRWRVDQGIRGSASGSTYIQREWAGLWSGSSQRYIVGERTLVLLRAPSAAGYTSPVADGIIPLHGNAVSPTLDLRWIAQHMAVSDSPRLAPVRALETAKGSMPLAAALLELAARPVATTYAPQQSAPGSPSRNAPVNQQPAHTADDPHAHVDGGMVFDLLRTWQRTSGAAQ